MKCLCCGKPITNSATNVEKEWCWHKKCVKRFFQTDELPILDITKEQLEILANETVNEGLTVPGVQKKLSLHLSTDLNARLTIVDYPTGYILKPQTEEFHNMPEFEDLAELFLRVVGSFVMGNSDMHLKNFSLKETEPGSRNFQLSKAYDMLPVNVIMPEDKEQLALTINGKKRNIHKKEFRILAESCGIPLNSAERMMKKVCSLKAKFFTQIEESYLSAEQKEQIGELISKRIDILS